MADKLSSLFNKNNSSSDDEEINYENIMDPKQMPHDKHLSEEQLSIFLSYTCQPDFFLDLPDNETRIWMNKFNFISNRNYEQIQTKNLLSLYVKGVQMFTQDIEFLNDKDPACTSIVIEIIDEIFYRATRFNNEKYSQIIVDLNLSTVKENLKERLVELKEVALQRIRREKKLKKRGKFREKARDPFDDIDLPAKKSKKAPEEGEIDGLNFENEFYIPEEYLIEEWNPE